MDDFTKRWEAEKAERMAQAITAKAGNLMKRKHIAPQNPLGLYRRGEHGVEPFKLAQESTVDHERLSVE